MRANPGCPAYEARMAAAQALAATADAGNERALFDALAAAGACRVEVSFGGRCEPWEIEDVQAWSSDGAKVELPDMEVQFVKVTWSSPALVHQSKPFWDVMDTVAYGFDRDTCDHLVFDVAARMITPAYNPRDSTS